MRLKSVDLPDVRAADEGDQRPRRGRRSGASPQAEPLQRGGALAPALLHLHVSARNTLQPRSRSRFSRARVPIFFSIAPPLPMTMAFCDSRSTTTSAEMRTSPAVAPVGLVELLHLDRRRVRDLLARLEHHLLAHVLRRELPLGLVGQHVGGKSGASASGTWRGERLEEDVHVLAGERRRTERSPPRRAARGRPRSPAGASGAARGPSWRRRGPRACRSAPPRRSPSGSTRRPRRGPRARCPPRRGGARRPPRRGCGAPPRPCGG